ncbi:MAG: ribonuclease P protein component [Chloroflexi bacterium]|nr:MAG: ribonuclease P protein component [Chloroflexota bacterium]
MSGEFEYSRAGFITGKSIGKAVQRNRVKRQLKAIFSNLIPFFLTHSDVLVIAREPIRNVPFDEIKSAVCQLLIKANLINPDDYDTRRSAS